MEEDGGEIEGENERELEGVEAEVARKNSKAEAKTIRLWNRQGVDLGEDGGEIEDANERELEGEEAESARKNSKTDAKTIRPGNHTREK